METKWMCHPDLPGQPIEVREESVSHYAHSGWLLMDGPPAEPEEKPIARATVHGEPYDEGEPADAKSNELPTGNADTKSSPDDDDSADDKTTGTRRVRRSTSKGDDK